VPTTSHLYQEDAIYCTEYLKAWAVGHDRSPDRIAPWRTFSQPPALATLPTSQAICMDNNLVFIPVPRIRKTLRRLASNDSALPLLKASREGWAYLGDTIEATEESTAVSAAKTLHDASPDLHIFRSHLCYHSQSTSSSLALRCEDMLLTWRTGRLPVDTSNHHTGKSATSQHRNRPPSEKYRQHSETLRLRLVSLTCLSPDALSWGGSDNSTLLWGECWRAISFLI
jgi:hypothetical protein